MGGVILLCSLFHVLLTGITTRSVKNNQNNRPNILHLQGNFQRVISSIKTKTHVKWSPMNQDAMHGNKASPNKCISVTHSLPYNNIYVGNGSRPSDFFQKVFHIPHLTKSLFCMLLTATSLREMPDPSNPDQSFSNLKKCATQHLYFFSVILN